MIPSMAMAFPDLRSTLFYRGRAALSKYNAYKHPKPDYIKGVFKQKLSIVVSLERLIILFFR